MSKVTVTQESLVVLEDVVKTYHMGEVDVTALNHTDLVLDRGEFVVILGPSGSGKTTLLNLIGGIDSPTAGRIVIDGEDISHYRQRELTMFRRRTVGFVFQFFNLIPTLTARENVDFALQLSDRGHRRGKDREDSAQLLAKVGLSERLEHFPSQLSGGEQQRVAVARALAKKPALILGDEPTGNLDFRTGKLVLSAMREVNILLGTTVVIVTHNQPLAAAADRVLHFREGRISRIEVNAHPIPPEDVEW
ncbi:MAG TPA: ABC transporter ATP-binding protein [Propionicimonas sp.]|nr:ABC transporter ATP-binding protein [Propionicimonas sp.]